MRWVMENIILTHVGADYIVLAATPDTPAAIVLQRNFGTLTHRIEATALRNFTAFFRGELVTAERRTATAAATPNPVECLV
jgi:hypothetical protein